MAAKVGGCCVTTYTVQLKSIKCKGVSDPGTNDEVWVLVQVDQGPPQRFPTAPRTYVEMHEDQTFNFDPTALKDFSFTFKQDVSLTLYDQDKTHNENRTDYLGTCDFRPSDDDGVVKTLTNGDSSKYEITWKKINWGTA